MSVNGKLTIGLTGGIGSGKSTIAHLFAELGVAVIDTDDIARELTSPNGVAMQAIVDVFGGTYTDSQGALNRGAMRQLVFSDVNAKRRLEEILHPLIRERALQRLVEATTAYGILVVPLLMESKGYLAYIDRVLVVDCNEQTQVSRTMSRNGLSEPAVRAIMASQVTRAERLTVADDVIENDGDIVDLAPRVDSLHQHYLALAGAAKESRDV